MLFFDDMALDIAMIEPNPIDWGGWVIYLLEKIAGEAKEQGINLEFEEMLISSQHYTERYSVMIFSRHFKVSQPS